MGRQPSRDDLVESGTMIGYYYLLVGRKDCWLGSGSAYLREKAVIDVKELTGIDEQTKIVRLKRMKRLPLFLLVLMAALFFVTLHRPEAWAGWLHAFAEAGMVGALADWFAVVALFRHPLGIPIPHTAIIPRRKNDIGCGFLYQGGERSNVFAARKPRTCRRVHVFAARKPRTTKSRH